jgi:hypothetical protein
LVLIVPDPVAADLPIVKVLCRLAGALVRNMI